MKTNSIAVVFGVLPKNNKLPGQVHACLNQAVELLENKKVQKISVIGGFGHGSRGQREPEAKMMKKELITKGVDSSLIIAIDTPVTTPKVIWEVRKLKARNRHILTVREKRKRISLLAHKIIGQKANYTIETVPYNFTADERRANQYEDHLLKEAERILANMTPGNKAAFRKLYSFKHDLWVPFIEELKAEGRFEEFLASL